MNKSDITILLDKSGSMLGIKQATLKGLNSFITEQKQIKNPATLTLAQFSTDYTTIYNSEDIKKVKQLKDSDFIPDGGTALYDSIAKTVNDVTARINSLSKSDKPDRIVIVIITDGEENSSVDFRGTEGASKIRNLLNTKESKEGWDFIYIGANQDAIVEGGKMGIAAASSLTFGTSDGAIGSTYEVLSRNMAVYRSCTTSAESKQAITYSDEDRKKVIK